MAKKQTIVKKPVGNGNISITIENNLKNTNPAPPPPVKRRRRRRQLISDPTDVTNSKIEDMLRAGGGGVGGGGGGGGLPPFRDVSYIKPGPINNFAVWRDNFNDSYNTTIPQGQAQQMGLLPLPKVEAPQSQLALPAPPPQLALPAPPTADAPLTMREFAAIMMQQGKARPGYQNLHDDPYNEDEPMEERYANLRPSSRIEEIDEDVLKEAGATDEQIQQYQEQIKQQKASVSTTNQQKLEAAGIDPETIKNVKQIRAIKTAGTWQGKRNIKPYGDYTDHPDFIASYNAGRALWLSQQPEERETAINRNKKYTLLAEGEDPWDGSATGLDADPQPPEDIFHDAETQNFDNINSEFVTTRKRGGRERDDGTTEEKKKRLLEAREKLIAEAKPKEVINDVIKGYKARKEARQLREQKQLKEEQAKEQEEEQVGKLLTKGMIRYQAIKDKKALNKLIKQALEAEIDILQEELKAGSREPRQPSSKSKGINKAMESLKDFWKKDTTEEAAKQAKKDAKKAKKEAEDKLSAKAKALQDKRKQLEALGK